MAFTLGVALSNNYYKGGDITYKSYLQELDKKIGTIKKNGKKQVFASLKYDDVFKGVCAKNYFFLKALLEYTLPITINNKKDIHERNTDIPKSKKNEYHNIADLFYYINKNIYVSLEMNTEYFEDVKHRNFILFNKLYSKILKKGEKPDKLKKIYFYQVNFNAHKRPVKYSSRQADVSYEIKGDKYINNYNIYLENLELHLENYYNGDRKPKTCLMAALVARNFSELYEMLLNVFTEDEATTIVEEVENMTFEEANNGDWEAYLLDREVTMEKHDRIEREKKEARENGHSQGFSEGHTQGVEQTAQNMLKKEFSLEDTAEITGLPIQKVKKLKAAL